MFLTLFSLVTQVTQRAESNNIPLGGFTPPSPAYSEGSENADTALANLESFVSNLIGFLTAMGSLFFVIYFITGAFSWITSGGDKGKLENARNRITQAVVGMIILVGSFVILGFISDTFFDQSFNLLKIGVPNVLEQ